MNDGATSNRLCQGRLQISDVTGNRQVPHHCIEHFGSQVGWLVERLDDIRVLVPLLSNGYAKLNTQSSLSTLRST